MRIINSLAFRLFFALLVIGVMIFAPMTLMILRENRSNLEYQILTSANQTNNLIMNTTRYSMIKNDRKAIRLTLLALKRIPEIDLVRVYSKEGISFSSNKEEIGQKVDERAPQCIVCHREETALVEIPPEETLQIFTSAEGHRYVTKIDPIINSRACALTDCHPAPEKQKVLGVLETRMSLDEVDGIMATSRSHMTWLSVMAIVVLETFVALFIWYFVHKRTRVLTEGAVKVGAGDFDHRVEVWGRDELGMLSESFNEMVAKVQQQTQTNLSLLENIAKAIKLLSNTSSKLYSITSQQASGGSEQVAAVQELLSASEEVFSTAYQISEAAVFVGERVDAANATCTTGKEHIFDSALRVDQIGEQVWKVRAHIAELSDQAQKIGSVVELIEEISEQIELLALNAAIEAAGAGEAGKRFDVVATEVGRLSNRALESTKIIKSLIGQIRDTIAQTAMQGQEEEEVVNAGIQSVSDLVAYFEKVISSVEGTSTASSEINQMTKQQAQVSEHMVITVKEVEGVAKDVETGIKEIESLMGELNAMSQMLQGLIDDRKEDFKLSAEGPENDPIH